MEKCKFHIFIRIIVLLMLLIFKKSNGFAVRKNHKNYFTKAVKKDGIPKNWVQGMNGKSYAIIGSKLGFYESSDICANAGGYLATVMNVNDQESVNDVIKKLKPKNEEFLWIGLNVEGPKMWIWQNNKLIVMNFMNWSPGQPASANAMQDCGAAGKDGTWFSVSCDEKHYGICEKIENKGGIINTISTTIGVTKPPPTMTQTKFLLNETKKENETKNEKEKLLKQGNLEKEQARLEKQKQTEEKRKKFTNGEKCNLINFINNYGKPVLITRMVNKGEKKEFVIDGKSYRLNTVFKKVKNSINMEPVVYTATDGKDDKKLVLDGKESFTLMPGDCDEDFVDVVIAVPEPVKGLVLQEGGKSEKPKDIDDGEVQKDENKNGKKCKVETFGGNSEDSCCHFPFKLNGRMYHDCTLYQKRHMWCGTTSDYDEDGRWGYCCQDGDCM